MNNKETAQKLLPALQTELSQLKKELEKVRSDFEEAWKIVNGNKMSLPRKIFIILEISILVLLLAFIFGVMVMSGYEGHNVL